MAALASSAFGTEGAPLLLLHGLFGSGRNWTRIARILSDSRQVYTLDLPNHGDSPWTTQTDYPAMAEALVGFLDDKGIGQVDLIGHSMGGKVAMALALTRPERLSRLLVADIAPVAYDHANLSYVQAMQALDLSGISRRGEADRILEPAIPDPGVRSFLLQNLVTGPEGFRWRLNLATLGASMDAIHGFPKELLTASYNGPTLFLTGANSDYVLPKDHDRIRRLFPKTRFESVSDAGHWLHAENPAGFLSAVEAFLAA